MIERCPFCGSSDELQITRTGAADEWWSEVFCDRCCTHGPTAQTAEEAARLWNTRAVLSSLPQEDDRELLDELRWLKRVTEDDTTNVYGRTIDRLLQLSRDVDLLREALEKAVAIVQRDRDTYVSAADAMWSAQQPGQASELDAIVRAYDETLKDMAALSSGISEQGEM
jgi:hypothetical protein